MNALQQSKTDYEDLEDIDEFDAEALPPTKDINVTNLSIIKKMIWIIRNKDYMNLSRHTRLVENLGFITTFCSVDRDGTISHSKPEQLIVPINKPEPVLIFDIEENPRSPYGISLSNDINDISWENYTSLLKPIANLFIQHTSCNMRYRNRCLENHNKQRNFEDLLWIPEVNGYCMCRLGNSIGIVSNSTMQNKYSRETILITCAPSHPSTKKLNRKYFGSLETIETTVKIISDDSDSLEDLVQVECYNSGDFDLLLSLSDSIWDGSSVIPMSHNILSELYSSYESASAQDLQCVAFSYRTLTLEKNSTNYFMDTLSHTTTNQNELIRLDFDWGIHSRVQKDAREEIENDEIEKGLLGYEKNDNNSLRNVLNNNRVNCEYTSSENKKLKSNESLIDNTSNYNVYTNSQKRDSVNDTKLKQVQLRKEKFDLGIEKDDHSINKDGVYTNRLDLENRNNSSTSSNSLKNDDYYDEYYQTSNNIDLPGYVSKSLKEDRILKQIERQLLRPEYSDADYTSDELLSIPREKLCSEVVDDQIFLGFATFCNIPKTDVCDFIEDLSIAGIRFVYFSESSGQMSKAFAERLGLETDWNTCIILSNEQQGKEGGDRGNINSMNQIDNIGLEQAMGYHEDYEIKAQLPRGIDSIRDHLAQVDDIPLQVSLFAESSPQATSEMFKIFSDYGEVVCCLSNQLGFNAFTDASSIGYFFNNLVIVGCISSCSNFLSVCLPRPKLYGNNAWEKFRIHKRSQ
ncbi:hypothetical protein BB559_002232 [Furculomyces boomerangus]|uniref:Uncharacterized protein n=1 Tax=Furculomyces boomerangus TaxID=61424 RepID=A0A2T9YX04_9FUNG|nr:hypothetical protein BB559_002232 [Furculomyces boomerangus]